MIQTHWIQLNCVVFVVLAARFGRCGSCAAAVTQCNAMRRARILPALLQFVQTYFSDLILASQDGEAEVRARCSGVRKGQGLSSLAGEGDSHRF